MNDDKQTKKELAVEIERLANQFADLNSRLNRVSYEKTKQGNQLDQLCEDNLLLGQSLGGMEARVIQLASTDADLGERWQTLQQQTSGFISMIESLPDQQNIQDTLQELTGQFESLQGEQQDLRSVLEAARHLLELVSNETGDLRRDTDDLTAHIRSLEESGSELSVCDSHHDSLIHDLQRTIADLNVRLTGAESLLSQQRNNVNDQAKQLNELTHGIGEQSRRAEVFKHLTAKLQDDTSELKESGAALGLRLDETERGIKGSEDAQSLLSQQLATLDQRLVELRDHGDEGMASLEDRLTGLTTQMVTQVGVGEGLVLRLDSLEPSVEGQQRSLENLHSEQERLAQAGTQYHERLAHQENRSNAIGEELAGLQSGHRQLTGKSDRQAAELEVMGAENSERLLEFENLAQQVKTLGGGVESVRARGLRQTWAIVGLFGIALMAGLIAYQFISERIAGTEQELAKRLIRQDEVHITSEQTQREIDHLKDAVASLQTSRLDNPDNQRVDERFARMEVRLTSLKGQVGQQFEQFENQSRETSSRQVELSAGIEGLTSSLADLKRRFHELTQSEPEQRWRELGNAGGYSIQLIGVTSRDALLMFAHKHELEGERAFVRAEMDGRDWYVLLYGLYGGFSEATEALKALPDSLRRYQPWIRPVPTEYELTPF